MSIGIGHTNNIGGTQGVTPQKQSVSFKGNLPPLKEDTFEYSAIKKNPDGTTTVNIGLFKMLADCIFKGQPLPETNPAQNKETTSKSADEGKKIPAQNANTALNSLDKTKAAPPKDINGALEFFEGDNFKNINFDDPNLIIGAKFDKRKFKAAFSEAFKGMSQADKNEVTKYYGFRFEYTKDMKHKLVVGFPTLNDDKKALAKKSPLVQKKIAEVRPIIEKYTTGNKFVIDGNKELENALNALGEKVPELYSLSGKEQNSYHSYTLDKHTLKVLQETIKNPEYETLSGNNKKTMKLAAIFHDISKKEWIIDRDHNITSARDAAGFLERLDLPKEEIEKACKLIKNHEWLKEYNQTEGSKDKEKYAASLAQEFGDPELFKMECILTKADLKSVKKHNAFYHKHKNALALAKSTVEKHL